MSKKTRTKPAGPTATLYERPDMDVLERMICSKEIDDDSKSLLRAYFAKRVVDDTGYTIPVKYSSSETVGMGRLYANKSLSLQCFKKEIRHALARNEYVDIDIENAHCTIMSQYCKHNDISCGFLEYYCLNREEVLEKICSYHDIDRSTAKELVISLCYLGGYRIDGEAPDKQFKFLKKFAAEQKSIAVEINEREDELVKIIDKCDDKKNKLASVVSICYQIIENDCLMAMKDFFTQNGYEVGTLCFDGLLVSKRPTTSARSILSDDVLAEMLPKCSDYIKKKTGYRVKLNSKPMNLELSFSIPTFSKFVDNDLDCQLKLFKIEGANKFRFCCGELYIFDERNGMYNTQIETLYYYLVKNKAYLHKIVGVDKNDEIKTESYGEHARLQRNIVPFVRAGSDAPDWIASTGKSSIGYLLFKDGIFDMKKGKFTLGYDQNIVFRAQVPHEFPKRNKKHMKLAYDLSFGTLFENPKPMIYALATALAGDKETLKTFYFCPGRSNAGKSTLVSILQDVFGSYIGTFNIESLTKRTEHDSKDEAQRMRWALALKDCRIIISNEASMTRAIDGEDIKKHSAGRDTLKGRFHGGLETTFYPQYTCFSMLNDIPKIEPMSDVVIKRLQYIEFPYVFVEKSEVNDKPYNRPRDTELGSKFKTPEFIAGFIHILLEAYEDFLVNGMPEFDEQVRERWLDGCDQKSAILRLINENFEYDSTMDSTRDMVTVDKMNRFKQQHNDVFGGMSATKFNAILREDLKWEQSKSGSTRYWKGVYEKDL